MSTTINPDLTGDPTALKGEPSSPGTNPEPKTYSAEEYDLIVRKHDHAYGKLRTLERQFEETKNRLAELEGKGGKKPEANDEAVKTITALKEQLDKANLQLRNATVKSEIRTRADGRLRPDSFESFWKLEGDNFDISEDDSGNRKVVVKGMEWLSLDEYFRDELPKRHPYFLASTRASGTGEPVKGEVKTTSTGDVVFPPDFQSWSQSQKTEFFKKLSAEQRQALQKMMPKG